MAVIDIFSKRRQRALGTVSDVYTYDEIPGGLRNQIVQIWNEAIGVPETLYDHNERETSDGVYFAIASVLRREYSVFTLSGARGINMHDKGDAYRDLTLWFMNESNTDRALDAIELSARCIKNRCSRSYYLNRRNAEQVANEALSEINVRFKEHGVGYQFLDGEIVRVDSQLIHQEAVVPALTVLRGAEYSNAHEEFLSAYEHYRHGNMQEALVDCYKCFESTMKVICTKRGWHFDPRASARDLVESCLTNGLIPPYWQTHFGGLRSVLESAISTPRNRQAGHGAGPGPSPDIPNELVSYVLHMTAATVLFLAEAEKNLS